MKREEAINLVTQVCAIYKGTLQEHEMLQTAIKVLKENLAEIDVVEQEKK